MHKNPIGDHPYDPLPDKTDEKIEIGNRGAGGQIGPVEAMILRSIDVLTEAYGASIQRHIESTSGREIALGQIYTSLDRMSVRHLIRSYKSSPEPVRGGRSKRIYSLTDLGKQALEYFVTTYAMIRQPQRIAAHETKPRYSET